MEDPLAYFLAFFTLEHFLQTFAYVCMGLASLWIPRFASFVGMWAFGTILTMALEALGEVVKFIVTLPYHFFKFVFDFFKFVFLGWRQVKTSDADNPEHD